MAEAGGAYKAPAYDSWQSLPAAFLDVAAAGPDRPFLWARRAGAWQPLTRREVERQARALSRGLRALGLEHGERVVLVAENRPEFLIADLAIMAAGGITVPAYTTNTEADHAHVLEDSGAALAICSTNALAKRLLPPAARAPECRGAILMEEPQQHPEAGELPVHRWQDVIVDGGGRTDDVGDRIARLGRDDTACFIYTSGTGGAPKGVMLSHGNLLANCKMAFELLTSLGLGDEVFLSFLPLSHSYEHTAGQFFPMTIGAEIYYSRGVEHLQSELVEVKPTVMTAVPRLYESMHQRILRGVEKAPRLRRALFHRTLDLGRRRYHKTPLGPGARLQDAVLDRLVRDKVRGRFGGRLKGMISGGAALDPEIGLFFTALGLRILQGYGQTEASPIVACNPPHNVKLHTVGPPLVGVEVKLASDNELLVRGPGVMQGYWRRPEHTAETVRDGWLHTGDLGSIDADGYIQITDRKKDIVVLSGGDTLSPARVEGFLTRRPEIQQAMVYGDKRPHLVALIVPDQEWAEAWAREHGKPADLGTLAEDPEFSEVIEAALREVNAEVSQPERVRRFLLAREPFTVDNDMMTPTLKIRRHKIREHYGPILEGLYAGRD